MSALLELAERCENATGPDRFIETAIAESLGWRVLEKSNGQLEACSLERGWFVLPRFTASIDAAMTLLPATTVNFDLFTFTVSGGEAWGCRFMDRAQLMGARAAKEEIKRLRKSAAFGRQLRGPPRVELEKAIAEHYLEFFCQGAATAALAVCSAALRARASDSRSKPLAAKTPKSGLVHESGDAAKTAIAQPPPVVPPNE